MRVYQLAKELNVQSALILEVLDQMGRNVNSDLSTLDADTAQMVKRRVTAAIEAEVRRINEERRQQELLREAERQRQAEAPGEPPAVPEAAAAPEALPGRAEPGPLEEPVVPAAAASPEPRAEPPPGRQPRLFAAKRAIPNLGVPSRRPAAQAPPPRGISPRTAPLIPRAPAMPSPMPPAPPRGLPGARPGPRPAPPPPGPPRKRRKKDKEAELLREVGPSAGKPKPELPPVPERIVLSEAVTVKELAEKLNRKSKDVIAKLIARGLLVTINQPLRHEDAIAVAREFGAEASVISFEQEAREMAGVEGGPAARPTDGAYPRAPVVTVMGHVDHGKTSLLDAIRATNVVAREYGGITQHIGAYQVEEKGRRITFLDTPGHEAFTMMRARGAKVTDIVVLVVAADDGVKPQTVEAIDHARAAGVPIVVAINKIDKPGASPDRVKQQLSERDLLVEQYGGTTVACEVSAKQRTGLQDLLDMILLVADLQELKADPDKPASGVVLEAKLDRARGVVATVLVQDGTLRVGDAFIAGTAHGKVRAMADDNGRRVEEAGPSTPVEVMGLAGEPLAGDMFQAVGDEARARQIASFRQEKRRAESRAQTAARTLESLSREIAEGQVKELQILLKADVQGSLEALQTALGDLPSDKIRVSVLRSSTGAISQADVLLASASDAIIVGFNVRPDRQTSELAKREEVEIRLYSVIYDVVGDIKQAMLGMLEPTLKETIIGQAEVRQLFKVPKVGIVAGCYVSDGKVARNAEVRLLRDNVVIYTGRVGSLKRFKDDVSEVKQGYECGIGIANYNDLKEGDVIEFFVTEKIAVETL
jgi:translation initiation factor IF-2